MLMVFVIPLPVRLRERKKHFSSLLGRLLVGRVGEEDRDYYIEHRRHIRVSTVVKVKVYRVHVVEKKSSNLDKEEIIFIPAKSFLNHLSSRYDAGIYVCISFRKLLRPRNFSINRKPRPIITFFVLWPVALVVKR